MKREWTRPEMAIEEFELKQAVADQVVVVDLNGKLQYPVEKGATIEFTYQCDQSGQGHWKYDQGSYPVTDLGKDGYIDWDDVVAALGTAQNKVVTGNGHQHHGDSITFIIPS